MGSDSDQRRISILTRRVALGFLLLSFAASTLGPSASAQQKQPARPIYKRKLIRLEPIFDTSRMEKAKVFNLNVEHTDLIVSESATQVLQASARIDDLGADRYDAILKATVTDFAPSTIETVEHGVQAKFFVDVQKLSARYAPEIARLMEAQLAVARRKALADVAAAKPLMDKQLAAKPRPRMPLLPGVPKTGQLPMPKAGYVSDNPINLALAEAQKQNLQRTADTERKLAAKVMDGARNGGPLVGPAGGGPIAGGPLSGLLPGGQMPEKPRTQVGSIPEFPKTAADLAIPSVAKPNLSKQAQEMSAKLSKPTDDHAAGGFLNGLDTAAKLSQEKAKAAIGQALPSMDAVLTYMRPHPNLKIPKPEGLAAEAETSIALEWDSWHKKFAELARNPILAHVRKSGNPSGNNTVEIIVKSNNEVAVRLIKPSTVEFDEAIVRAYESLNGNKELQFPARSRRSSISFLVDNKHFGPGVAGSVQSTTATGDKEFIRK